MRASRRYSAITHNVKFGLDIHRLHRNHYEITAPSFNFAGAQNDNMIGGRMRNFPLSV